MASIIGETFESILGKISSILDSGLCETHYEKDVKLKVVAKKWL